jgi:hypothetical protein
LRRLFLLRNIDCHNRRGLGARYAVGDHVLGAVMAVPEGAEPENMGATAPGDCGWRCGAFFRIAGRRGPSDGTAVSERGSTNPFVSLFLTPVAIAAAALRARYAWSMATLTGACYTLLLLFFRPLAGQARAKHSDAFNLHILGVWITFLASALAKPGNEMETAR